MRIAYVEDNPTNLALVERIARMTQHQVVSYTEGEVALQELQSEKYDLILMDIELAGTVSGLEVVRVLREYGLKTPIIAVTAYAMMGDRDKCLAAGCDDYLPKPLPITEFLAMLAKYDARLKAPAPVSVQPTVAPAPIRMPRPFLVSDTQPSKPTGLLPTLPANLQPAVPAVKPPAESQPPVPPAAPPSTPAPAPASAPPVPPAPVQTSGQPPAVQPPAPPAPVQTSAQPPAVQPPVPPVTPPIQPAAPPPSVAKETADNGQRPAGTQEASASSNAANAQPPAAPKEIRMLAHPVDPDEKRTF
jgi:CheY-like chemotaxis protein